MNYADIIWKLVEQLLDEKDKEKTANVQSNKVQAND